MRRFIAPLLLLAPFSQAAVITQNFNFNGLNLVVPDGNPSGLTNVQDISSTIQDIDSVQVSLGISGTFNGDLYVSLNHLSGFSVLLNRVGKTAANPVGYDDDGFNVTLDDSAANNIHTYQVTTTPAAGTSLMGAWQADGRNIDPDLVLDTTPVTAGLSVFEDLDASGEWTLFVADVASPEGVTLESWGLSITGDTVPEPSSALCLSLGMAALLRRRRIS